MRKRVMKWMAGAALSTVVILLYLFLFQTHLFSKLSINLLNLTWLERQGLQLSGRLEGGLLGRSIGLSRTMLTSLSTGDTLFAAQQFRVEGHGIDFDLPALTVEKLFVHNYLINIDRLQQALSSSTSGGRTVNTTIQDFDLQDGLLLFERPTARDTAVVAVLTGDLWYLDGYVGIQLRRAHGLASTITADSLNIIGLLGHAPDAGVSFTNLQLLSSRAKLVLNGNYNRGDMDLNVTSQGLQPAAIASLQLPEYIQGLTLDAVLQIDRSASVISLSGSGVVHQDSAHIPFQLIRYESDGISQTFEFKLGSEYSYLNLISRMDSLGYFEGNADLFRADLNPFIPVSGLTFSDPIGMIRFSGSKGNFKLIPEIQHIDINGVLLDSLKTQIIYRGSELTEIMPGTALLGQNLLSFSGGLREGEYDLHGKATLVDFDFIKRHYSDLDLTGRLDLDLAVSGSLAAPRIVGVLSTRELGLGQNLALTGKGKFDLRLEAGRILGEFAIQGVEGRLFGNPLRQFAITTDITETAFRVDEFNLQGSGDLIALSGQIGDFGIDLDKLRMLGAGHQLKLVNSVKISRGNDGVYTIPPTIFTFNRGGLSVEGQYDPQQGYDLESGFDLVNLTQLMEFLRLKVDFKGMASGTAHVSGDLMNPNVHANFLLQGGSTLGYPSDSARVDVTLTGFATNSQEIFVYSHGGKLKLVGQLPWGYKVRGDTQGTTAQNFSVQVENYLLSDLKFTSVAGLSLSGRSTGILSIRGTPLDTKMDGHVELTDAKYDTLRFSSGYVSFGYEDDLLTFDSLSMVSNWGYGSGSGYLPLSLDLMAVQRPDLSKRDLGLRFDFTLNEMPFLTSYISSIDAIQGDFTGNFSLSGPFAEPVRNGKIRGHNGRLELSVLGNPITDIHSEFTLIDNTMTIDHFSGRMFFSAGSALNIQGALGRATSFISDLIGVKVAQNYKGQVNASGRINFDTFFEPRFDLQLKAKEVYYRSTDGQIEAIADADLHFVGQDTLDVTAIIPVSRAVYYSNFESTESYQSAISQKSTSLFKYSLDTQFSSDLLISNDQMEAEFEGELWLLDYGDGIMRFSGQLTAQEGGKFFYLGNELSIVRGEIIFNSVDFNPQISMEASIEIDGELVTLVLTGDLDEPELVINADNSQLTQSDVLAYLTINQKLVEVSFDTKSALNPVKTYSEMLMEKQISKIGREFTGLDILDVGINLDSDTTTVSRFEVGQRISKNLKVTYGGELQAVAGQSDYDFGLEYQINKNVSVTSKINQDGEVELNGRLKFTY